MPNWFNKGWTLALSLLQEVLFRPLEVLSWVKDGFGSTLKGLKMALEVLSWG